MSNLLNRLQAKGSGPGSRSSFAASNAIVGTGIDSKAAATSYSATAALMNVFNTESVASPTGIEPISIWINSITLTSTQANSNASNLRFVGILDAPNATRWSSGGVALTNVERGRSNSSSYTERTAKGEIYFGELTLGAETDANKIFDIPVSNDVIASGDIIEVNFGDGTPRSKANGFITLSIPEFKILPGCNFSLHEVAANQTNDSKFQISVISYEWGHQGT